MKYSCGVIRDLLPLYHDKVCSDDSATVVKEHLQECEECRRYSKDLQESVMMDAVLYDQEIEQQKIESIKQVKKRIKRKTGLVVLGAILGSLLVFSTFIYFFGTTLLGVFAANYVTSPVQQYSDINQFEEYVGENAKEGFKDKWGMDESILPKHIQEGMKVEDFKVVYYNPFDAQYLTYLTVDYSEEDYKAEVKRLSEKGMDDYIGYYGVSGAPEGYRILAMDADDYQGFVYAMTPEVEQGRNESEGEKYSITYVEIIFCNYFLDLDIHKYVPEKYILHGFDGSEDNAYRREKLGKN